MDRDIIETTSAYRSGIGSGKGTQPGALEGRPRPDACLKTRITFNISPGLTETMRIFARFRVLAATMFCGVPYRGNTEHMNEDLKHLRQQQTIRCRTLWLARGGEKKKFVRPTKQ